MKRGRKGIDAFQIGYVDLQKVAMEEMGRELTAVDLDSAARYFENGMYWRGAASEAVQSVADKHP